MIKLEVFDPPMCCSTGICGASVDPTLVTFASDLEWLKTKGIDVVRYGLSFKPAEFVNNDTVKNLLNKEGNGCLPVIMIGSELLSKSCYPSREKLASICKINFDEDEAPAVHREENCCCGVDCDCNTSETTESVCSCSTPNCDCTNAPAEDNCFCTPECDFNKADSINNFTKIIFIIGFVILVCIIALKILFF